MSEIESTDWNIGKVPEELEHHWMAVKLEGKRMPYVGYFKDGDTWVIRDADLFRPLEESEIKGWHLLPE